MQSKKSLLIGSILASFAVGALFFFQNCDFMGFNSVASGPTSITVHAPSISSLAAPFTISNLNSITISGSCDSGATVHLNGAVVAAEVSHPSNSLAQACSGGVFSFVINKSTDGIYQFSFSQDIKGVFSANTSLYVWQRDTVAPNAVTLSSPGTNPYYSSVNDANLVIQGSCESTALVELSGDATGAFACSGSSFSFTVPEAIGSTNHFSFSIKQTDLAGNDSSPTTLVWERQDLPTTPTIASPAASPLYTNGDSVTISGACTDGYSVDLSGADTQSTTCASSAYSFTVSKTDDDNYGFSITQSNNIPQTSAAATTHWVRDTDVPATPTITAPAQNPDLTAASAVQLIGDCEADATVTLTPTGGKSVTQLCVIAGQYLFPLTMDSDGTQDYSLTQTDLAGNTSAAATFTYTRDTSVPASPMVSVPASSSYASNADSLTNEPHYGYLLNQ